MNSTSAPKNESIEGEVVAIIPARGGSKGIPLKNLRQVGLRSLIAYTIEEALLAEKIDRVIVSTDSERIAEEGKKEGAEVPFLRPDELSDDKAPLAAVMRHFLDWAEEESWKIKALVILEPTSPLRTRKEIDEAVELFLEKEVETVVSVEKDTIIWWEKVDGEARELVKERVNRQFMKPKYKENGAIFVTKPEVVTSSTTIGKKVALYEMTAEKSIDINNYFDMRLADIFLRSVKIVFHFKATALLGFGHFYRVLALANRLYSNDILLVCSEYDQGLEKRIETIGFRYILTEKPLEVIKKEKPTIVVNDVLDTTESFMKELKELAPMIVNFEDLGEGNKEADLVFNALYEDHSLTKKQYGGGKYAIMREEFMFLPEKKVKEKVELITVTFGGSDPNNITYESMKEIPVKFKEITFRYIIGPGYKYSKKELYELKEKNQNVEIVDISGEMVKHLTEADLVITSGGRTVFETALCGTANVVICQNEREMQHRHISAKDGVINLGLFDEKTIEELIKVIGELEENREKRKEMQEKSEKAVDSIGIFRVIGMIEKEARKKGIAKML